MPDDCLRICERICRIVFWEGSLSVVRKPYALYAYGQVFQWIYESILAKIEGQIENVPNHFSHNLLYLCYL